MSRRLMTTCAALALSLGGCSVGPDYRQPELSLPLHYRGGSATAGSESFADLQWREVFTEPQLQALIQEGLAHNLDLTMALARVEQSRARSSQARSGFFPSIGYQSAIGRGRNASLGQAVYNQGQTNTTVLGTINAAWEIDLWGRVRRLNEAAQAEYLATEEAARAVTLLLITEIAENYYLLRSLSARKQIAQNAVESYGQSLDLFDFRFQGGVASQLEVHSAEGALELAKALQAQLEQASIQQENALSILIGKPPRSFDNIEPLPMNAYPLDMPTGLPSQLLERRFDVLQAEQALRATVANIGVAKANFFPRLDLTGLLGRVSNDLSGVTAGSANAWSIAAGLSGPIFQGGLLRGQFDEAVAIRNEAVAHYEATVLNALREVSDQLVAREQLRKVRTAQSRAVAAYGKAVVLSRQRYSTGLADYLDVLQAQQNLFPGEDQLAQTIYQEWAATVQLYRVLGGGWNDIDIRNPRGEIAGNAELAEEQEHSLSSPEPATEPSAARQSMVVLPRRR